MKKLHTKFTLKLRCSDQSGFTLIEVIVAISVLTVGLLGVATMQSSAIRENYLSSNVTTALTLAEFKMEDLLNRQFTDSVLDDNDATNNGNLTSITTLDHPLELVDDDGTVGAGIYQRYWNIADNTPATNNKTLAVIVTWDNNKHRVTLSSIKRL